MVGPAASPSRLGPGKVVCGLAFSVAVAGCAGAVTGQGQTGMGGAAFAGSGGITAVGSGGQPTGSGGPGGSLVGAGGQTPATSSGGASSGGAGEGGGGVGALGGAPVANGSGGDHGSGGTTASGGGGGIPAAGGAAGASAGIPMFVAQGTMGRTTISCDDGLTWVANHSDDDSARCYSNGNLPDCDHGTSAGRGMTSGGGWFFVSFGWGTPGTLRRSRDGVTWEPVLAKNQMGSIAFGNGRVQGGDNFSDDLGMTWTRTTGADLGVSRTVGFLPQAGGHFLLVGDNGSYVSKAGGGWTKIDTGCGASVATGQGVVASPTTALLVTSDKACRSTDGGLTWKTASLGGTTTSLAVWDGTAFHVWGAGKVYSSPDGATWTTTATTPSNLKLGAVSVSAATGTFVAVHEEWKEWYDSQVFHRSRDGVHWDTLPKTSFVPSHQIVDLQFDYGQPSSVCPGAAK